MLVQALRERYREALRGERSSERLAQVVDFLIGHPIVSVRQVQAGMNAGDYKTAQRLVGKLEEAGIVREVTGGARNRIYRADEILGEETARGIRARFLRVPANVGPLEMTDDTFSDSAKRT